MSSSDKVVLEVKDGPELLDAPKEHELGIYPEFHHPEQDYGWLRDRIIIFQQEGPGGSEPVSLQVNGLRVDVPREVECDVARPYVDLLRNTVETRFEYRENEQGKVETVARNVPRYHWNLLAEGVNRLDLKAKAKKFIEAENARRMKAWEEARNGDHT